MKRIAILYFSGTGNTKFVAKNIKEELEKNNIKADLVNIEEDKINVFDYESLIIGGPVYVEKYPKILFKYIDNNIPRSYLGKCMIFTTQASDKATTAFQDFTNKEKFLNVTYCAFVPMPNNFYNFMFERKIEEEEKIIIEESIGITKKAVDNFLQGKTNFYPAKKKKLSLITMIYNMYYPHISKITTKKIKIDADKCIKCGLCEKRCPVNAIKITDNVVINKDCLLCQRCMSSCPKDAFWYKDKKYIQYKLNCQK